MTLSNISSHFTNSWTILIDLGMVSSFIAKVKSGKIFTFSSLYLISGKGKGYFQYIKMLQSFFHFRIAVAKYCFKYSGEGILYSCWSMIFVCLLKLKITLCQLINKLLVHLAAVNIFILPTIGWVFYTVWSLHKAYISCSIAYKTTAVVYFLITDILVEVHIVVWYEKLSNLCFL